MEFSALLYCPICASPFLMVYPNGLLPYYSRFLAEVCGWMMFIAVILTGTAMVLLLSDRYFALKPSARFYWNQKAIVVYMIIMNLTLYLGFAILTNISVLKEEEVYPFLIQNIEGSEFLLPKASGIVIFNTPKVSTMQTAAYIFAIGLGVSIYASVLGGFLVLNILLGKALGNSVTRAKRQQVIYLKVTVVQVLVVVVLGVVPSCIFLMMLYFEIEWFPLYTIGISMHQSMLVVIIHPEQWNGGSDRCTIGMIRHFAGGGHRVVWYTTMIDEYWAKEDFFGIEIREIPMNLHPGDWFSQNVALAYNIVASDLNPDLIVVDHSASCVPILKWRFPESKVLFYCHFPQQLVTPSRFFLYRWYSKLIGLIEAKLYESADVIMVNSKFTASSFAEVMPSICESKIRVVYPPCDVDSLSIPSGVSVSRKKRPQNEKYVFLSMNRFWPEKRLDIIVEAAALLKKAGFTPKIQLAGSVMPHIPESRIYYELLKCMVKENEVEEMIEFIISPTEDEKFRLYRECDSALYTPPNEHFGIVPIEALEQRRPVIVIDSGGPAETVIEGVTGTKIKEPDGYLLAEAMMEHMKRDLWEDLDTDDKYVHQRKRFEEKFSLQGFGARIEDALVSIFPGTYIGRSIPHTRRLSLGTTSKVIAEVPSEVASEVSSGKPSEMNSELPSKVVSGVPLSSDSCVEIIDEEEYLDSSHKLRHRKDQILAFNSDRGRA